jgi:tripartite-type tricarboxylate transporter receptor subunit TctC
MRILTMIVSLLMSFGAHAYPDKPVHVVIPYPVGGGTDILARYVLAKVTEDTGWRIVIENKAGATGIVGAREVSAARPDGYTLLMGHIAPNGINPGDFQSPRMAPDWKLAPVALVAEAPLVLIAHKDSGIINLDRFRSDPPKTFGSDGVGSLAHLYGEQIMRGATHVPYKGGGPALQGLMGGEVPVLLSPLPVALPQIGSGRFVVLAHTGSHRIPMLASVPPIGGLSAPLWWGMFAPDGTRDEVIGMWSIAIESAMRREDVRRWLVENGYTASFMGPKAFGEYVARERDRWSR